MTTNSIHAGAYFLSNSLHSTNRKYTSLTILLPLPSLQHVGCAATKRGLLVIKFQLNSHSRATQDLHYKPSCLVTDNLCSTESST